MADYQNLMTDDEKDDVIVSFMRSQVQDRYCLQLNHDRYVAMLQDTGKGGPGPQTPRERQERKWRTQIEGLYQQSLERMAQLDSIIKATLPQMPSDERVMAAMGRIKEK